MVCDCCGRKQKLFESFSKLKHDKKEINLCASCNDWAFKIRDDYNEKDVEKYISDMENWKKAEKKPSQTYIEWKKTFISKYTLVIDADIVSIKK